jgi:peptide/nickel transport system permease protein
MVSRKVTALIGLALIVPVVALYATFPDLLISRSSRVWFGVETTIFAILAVAGVALLFVAWGARQGRGFWRYALRRALLIPAQLLFVLFVLYCANRFLFIFLLAPPGERALFLSTIIPAFYSGLVVPVFSFNWGPAFVSLAGYPPNISLNQLFADLLPSSLQLALFALPLSLALAYPVSMAAGWSRRPGLDAPARFTSLLAALLPVFVVATLVLNALFFGYLGYFQDVPSQGLIPSVGWFIDHGGYPSWILYDSVTRPTGFPLVDALLHHAWTIAAISFTKTLIQASVVAIAYVAIFYRHAQSAVRSASEELHIVGARARGISERTLLWRYAAKRATPSLLLIIGLTIPEYLVVQFAVEAAFADQGGFGFYVFTLLNDGQLGILYNLVFLIAIFVLIWVYLVDLIAVRLDPRGVNAR